VGAAADSSAEEAPPQAANAKQAANKGVNFIANSAVFFIELSRSMAKTIFLGGVR
jgi:hypothetical protein